MLITESLMHYIRDKSQGILYRVMHHTAVTCLQEHCPLGLTTHLVSSGWALGKLPQPGTLQRVRLEARGSGMSEGVGGTVPTDGATCRGHSPVPGAGGRVSASSPNRVCVGCGCVFTSKRQAWTSRWVGAPGSGRKVRAGFGGTTSGGCPWDICASAACLQRAPSWTSWRAGDPRGGQSPGVRAEVRGDREAVLVLGGPVAVRLLMSPEAAEGVLAQVTSCLCQPRGGDVAGGAGVWLLLTAV